MKKLVAVDSSPEMLDQCQLPAAEEELDSSKVLLDFDSPGGLSLFEDESVDLVTTNLSMHWVNDLPGLFKEVNRDGCYGDDTMFLCRDTDQTSISSQDFEEGRRLHRFHVRRGDPLRAARVAAIGRPRASGRDQLAHFSLRLPTGKV